MTTFCYLSDADKEQCFIIYRKGTVFQNEPACITAYDICMGLNQHFRGTGVHSYQFSIPLRDAHTGRHFTEVATPECIDKMINWLRRKHDIFYAPGINPDVDSLSWRVERFWADKEQRDEEAKRLEQQKIEEYCKNDVACTLSLKKMHMQYVAHHEEPISSTDFKTRFDLFVEKVWEGVFDEEAPVATSVKNKTARAEALYEKLVGLKKERDELKERNEQLARDYEALWKDRERKKRVLNSFYGASCGYTADAIGEVQRLKKEHDELKERLENLEGGGYTCSDCKRTTCGYFTEILSTLGVKNAVVYPPRGRSKVECFAKLANERAQAVMKENRVMARTIDTHVERLNNQEEIIKTQNKSLERQARQLKDLGVALGNVKNTVDFEIDTLMADHGDEIIPEF